MIFSDTHQKIEELQRLVPDSFVFVLDTNDRSFIYTSYESVTYKDFIFSLDKTHGLEKLTQNDDFCSLEEGEAILKIQKTEKNIFLGVCVSDSYSPSKLMTVDKCFDRFNSESQQ